MPGVRSLKVKALHDKIPGFAAAVALALIAAAVALAACSPTTAAVGAGATVGATAVQDRGVEGAAKDTWIRAQISQKLLAHSGDLYLDVHLQVQNGRVLLSGTVPTPQARVEAVRIAWMPDGVREVINEIELSDDSSFSDLARDLWIMTRLRAKLLGDKDVNSLNVSIESVNQSVYLIGVVHSEDELNRVVGHAKTVPYVRRVVSYLTLKPSSSS